MTHAHAHYTSVKLTRTHARRITNERARTRLRSSGVAGFRFPGNWRRCGCLLVKLFTNCYNGWGWPIFAVVFRANASGSVKWAENEMLDFLPGWARRPDNYQTGWSLTARHFTAAATPTENCRPCGRRPSSVKSSSIKVRNLPKSKIIIVNVTVVGVMFRDRGQVRGELVGRTQHLHRTGRELPYQSLLVRHLVLTVNKKETKRLGKVSKQDFIFKAWRNSL